jgi:hypothetical protein
VGAVLIGTLLAASSLVERIAKRVPRAVLPVDGFEVAVAPTSRWPADTHTAAVRVDPWTRYSLVKGYFEVWRDSRSVASVAFMNEPIGAGPEGPLGLAIRPRMLGGFAPIRLDVSTNLASRAWERCLAGHLALHGDWDPERAPEIWRVRPPGHPDPPRNPLPSPLAAICLPQRRPFVESAAGREVNWVPGDSEDPARAAIAIGFPIITRAGWRLRLDDELTDPSDAPGLRVQNLLSPDHIVRRAPVAVVIGRPGAPRLVPDSRIANRLRGFANEVFLAGAHAVIAVPSLPPKRTAEVIELFSEEATTWSSIPDSERLRLLAARLRGVVFRPLPKPPEDGEDDPVRWERERLQRAELALDVCLFAPR